MAVHRCDACAASKQRIEYDAALGGLGRLGGGCTLHVLHITPFAELKRTSRNARLASRGCERFGLVMCVGGGSR